MTAIELGRHARAGQAERRDESFPQRPGVGLSFDKPLWLVEGETDTWALWERFIPALGLPGSGMTTKLDRCHLRGFSTIYIWQEPDQAGGKFATGLVNRLAEVYQI